MTTEQTLALIFERLDQMEKRLSRMEFDLNRIYRFVEQENNAKIAEIALQGEDCRRQKVLDVLNQIA